MTKARYDGPQVPALSKLMRSSRKGPSVPPAKLWKLLKQAVEGLEFAEMELSGKSSHETYSTLRSIEGELKDLL